MELHRALYQHDALFLGVMTPMVVSGVDLKLAERRRHKAAMNEGPRSALTRVRLLHGLLDSRPRPGEDAAAPRRVAIRDPDPGERGPASAVRNTK